MENRVTQSNWKVSTVPSNVLGNPTTRALFIDWSAGFIGGFASATICAPFDLSRTRHMLLATTKSHGTIDYKGFLHTISRIYRDEGIRGLYKGYSVTAISIPIFHSLYFSLFYKGKEMLNRSKHFQESELLRNILASFGAGLICNTVTNPLWVVRTRIQSQFLHQETIPKYTSLFGGLKRICKEEGPKALFKGLGASYFGLSHAVILYPLYEYLKTLLKEWKGTPSSTDIFMASLISKFVAMVLTYPHTVLRARLQDHRAPSFIRKSKQANAMAADTTYQKATISSVIRNTYRKEGLMGFYSGLRIDLVRVLPANSIMFVMFELVKKQLEQRFDDMGY